MEYLRLNEEQMDFHDQLMGMPMYRWPKGLVDYICSLRELAGGDALACAVAAWIKTQTP